MKKAFVIAALLLSVPSFRCRPRMVVDLYPTAGVVTEVDRDTDTVTFKDATGHLWAFSEAEDWMVGDRIACIMDTRGTDSIRDDRIVSTRYCG